MLGSDFFKVEVKADLGYRRNKALILFYNPLIGNDAHYLYEFLCMKGTSNSFEELNKLLNSTRYSIDKFEDCLKNLNKYGLITTLKKKKEDDDKTNEDKYIFVLENPLDFDEFNNDPLLVRDFILKTSGSYYQMLVMEARNFTKHKGFDDVSYKFDLGELENWRKGDDSYLKPVPSVGKYEYGTMFNIDVLLKDMSTVLFPLKYRTDDNLKEIAKLADLYNISYDKMRIIISKVVSNSSKSFNLEDLKSKCMSVMPDYRIVEEGNYKVPCELFLMNKQGGKEATPYDKKVIFELSNKYFLNPEVINVLIEYTLENCNNQLMEKYMYSIASDLHRNGIKTSEEALDRLNGNKIKKKTTKKKDIEVVYDSSKNKEVSKEELEALRKYRGNND